MGESEAEAPEQISWLAKAIRERASTCQAPKEPAKVRAMRLTRELPIFAHLRARSAVFELLIACVLWGFGFVAATWAIRGGFGPHTVTAVRLSIAGAICAGAVVAIPSWRRALSWETARLAVLPGFWLCLTLVLQTWGLKYTTVTKSGFVTTLYVLIVPFLERWLLRRPLPNGHFSAVAIALVGCVLITDLGQAEWNVGDLLTLGCAIAASFQILWFGFLGDRTGNSFVFNGLQTLWAAPIPIALALATEAWPIEDPGALAWAGLASLTFGSTLIAFSLQVRAQKTLRPATASLIFLMESPLAAIFGLTLLNEHMSRSQWAGAALIMGSVLFTTSRPRIEQQIRKRLSIRRRAVDP